jgi:hypothetical protein
MVKERCNPSLGTSRTTTTIYGDWGIVASASGWLLFGVCFESTRLEPADLPDCSRLAGHAFQ